MTPFPSLNIEQPVFEFYQRKISVLAAWHSVH